jgi:hypothetical protein
MQEKNPILSILVLLVIVGAAIGILFLVFKPGTTTTDNDVNITETPSITTTAKLTVTPTVGVTTKATVSVTPVSGAVAPSDWKAIENTSQGYTAYRPAHFYFRLFSPDMFALGIDPNAIPSASEYMGTISLIRLSASNSFADYTDQLQDGYTTYTRIIDGRTWIMVVGITEANEITAAKYVILGNFSVGSKEYMARLESSSSDYAGYKDEFETFITTLDFTE